MLLQSDDSDEAVTATKLLSTTGECLFDLLPSSPRLLAVTYNSRSNKPYERSYHSCVRETACGRWAIAHLRRYVWGKLFYWMCDCTAVKEILKYFGPVH